MAAIIYPHSIPLKSSKKDRNAAQELEQQVKDIKQQFTEQTKCLEVRTENQTSLLTELQDFYKKRAEIEADYAKNLDKFAKQLIAKQKAEKHKRESWATFSIYSHYQQLIDEAKIEGRNRAALADLYQNHIICKLSNEVEELQRISKRCREISVIAQQEIFRVLDELHTATKTYHLSQTAATAAEAKFRTVEAQKCRFEEANPKKIGARKHRFLEKEFEKKHAKHLEFQLKALGAKNEYLLCIDAANAALHKYFADDLSDLLDCADVGCEGFLRCLLMTICECRQSVNESECRHIRQCSEFAARDLDHRADKRRFLDANHSTFTLPKKFEFRPTAYSNQPEVEHQLEIPVVAKVKSHKALDDNYTERRWQMNQRLIQLRAETEEVWKALETAERTLMDIQRQPEVKWADLFILAQPPPPPASQTTGASCNIQQITAGSSSTPTSSSINQNFNGSPLLPIKREHYQQHAYSTSGVLISQASGGSANKETACASSIDLIRRNSCREPDASQQKRKHELQEIETFYLQKFQRYLITGNLIRRLEVRHDAISAALNLKSISGRSNTAAAHNDTNVGSSIQIPSPSYRCSQRQCSSQSVADIDRHSVSTRRDDVIYHVDQCQHNGSEPGAVKTRRKRRIGASAPSRVDKTRPKLFGGSIEEYAESTGFEIPPIVKNCIRMLNVYGLHHQGVFRVSGSQIEINNFRDAFERGDDPLTDVTDSSDVNSVAGVLKLYFRELREPLFPIFMFDQFVECSRIENKEQFALKVRDLVLTLPRPVFVVMRYLFAFLNHLSEFSDENMMDPYNLAICFGPTLLPIPESRDQVFFHNHVNELIKNMILLHDSVFPKFRGELRSLFYEKYLLGAVPTDMNEESSIAPSSHVHGSNATSLNSVAISSTLTLPKLLENGHSVGDRPILEDQSSPDDDQDKIRQRIDSIVENDEEYACNITEDEETEDNITRSVTDVRFRNATGTGNAELNCNSDQPFYDQRRRSFSDGSYYCQEIEKLTEKAVKHDDLDNLVNRQSTLINDLSFHESLRAIDSPCGDNADLIDPVHNPEQKTPTKHSTPITVLKSAPGVWHPRRSLIRNGTDDHELFDDVEKRLSRSPKDDKELSLSPPVVASPERIDNLENLAKKESFRYAPRHHPYAIYSNLHTSLITNNNTIISKPSPSADKRRCDLYANIQALSNHPSALASVTNRDQSPTSVQQLYQRFSDPISSTTNTLSKSYQASNGYISTVNGAVDVQESKFHSYRPTRPSENLQDVDYKREKLASSLKRLSLTSYPAINVVKQINFNSSLNSSNNVQCSSPNPSYQVSNLSVDLNNCGSDCQASKGLSPTSLKEIVELKTVLSSLESFSTQTPPSVNTIQVSINSLNATSSEDIERRFGLGNYRNPTVVDQQKHAIDFSKSSLLSSTSIDTTTPVSPPDLVQNLPAISTTSSVASIVASYSAMMTSSTTTLTTKPSSCLMTTSSGFKSLAVLEPCHSTNTATSMTSSMVSSVPPRPRVPRNLMTPTSETLNLEHQRQRINNAHFDSLPSF